MPTIDIKLPNLGDGIKSGDILEVLVKVGETIKKDQGIFEVETDKASVEVPSSHAGKVTQINVKQGQSVEIGGSLLTLEVSEGAGNAAPTPAKPTPAAQAAPAPEKPAPEKPAPKQTPASEKPASTKPTPAASAPPTPKPAAPATAPAKPASEPVVAVAEVDAEVGDDADVAAGPAVRRFAREVGVDLKHVTGSGPGARITREDVLNAVRSASHSAKSGNGAPAAAKAGSGQSDNWGPVRLEKMPKIRKVIAQKMHESWSTCPRVTNFDDVDVTELEKIRQSSKNDYAQAGIKLTTLPFIVKACAMALRNHPTVNASIDMENEQIVYKEYVNIGIAVDSDRGLVVPSLRGVDHLSVAEVARGIGALADKIRDSNFGVDDLRGSTFTISNLGSIGGTYSTPMINYPEVAILLVGRARKLPVVVEGDKIEARLMMPLSLSYDHRLIDGATAARFLNDVMNYLKAPGRLLLAP